MYYSGYQMLTYNCLFNFVIGNRGAGKTYWATEWAIKDFLKDGSQFIYLRRYDTEFDQGKKELFFKAIEDKFPDHTFKVKGYTALIDGKVAGYFRPLSKAKIEKSVSYPDVNKILYDEFILDKGLYHYLPDEVINFLEFYETVARTRNNVRAVFLSNAVTVTNPYFLYWKININNKTFQRPREDVLVNLVSNKDFIEMKNNTRFGKLIRGTKYGEYAVDNVFLRDDDTFIGKKTGTARHYFILKYKGKRYGVWISYSEGKYYVSNDIDPSCKLIYSITLDDHSPNTMLIKGKQSKILGEFTKNYQMGNVIFEDMNIKNVTYEIIRLFLL